MTLLLTRCDECGQNFMLADTEEMDGTCFLCGKRRSFSTEEMDRAEAERDRLSEKYEERMQRAYEEKDLEAMSSLAEEAGNAGVSSWFAWFFIGWHDMYGGRTDDAFKDLELSVSFLDEESLDEFVDLALDACIEGVEKSIGGDKPWIDSCEAMFSFDETLEERFGNSLMMGFIPELINRMAFIDIGSDLAGRDLAATIASIAMAHTAMDLYVPDHFEILENASGALEQISCTEGPFETARSVADAAGGAVARVYDMESDLCKEAGDSVIDALYSVWLEGDRDRWSLLMDVLDESISYGMSGKHNKGAKKRMEAALEEYRKALEADIEEARRYERSQDDAAEAGPYGGSECPDCGRFVPADSTGLLECPCGFRGRIVTKAVDDLPDDLEELHRIARKAFDERDSEMLNNAGEHILYLDGSDWIGCVSLAYSCALDGEAAEAVQLIAACCQNVGSDGEEFLDRAAEVLSEGIRGISDEDGLLMAAMTGGMFASFPSTERPAPVVLAERILGKGFGSAYSVAAVAMMARSIMASLRARVFSMSEVKESADAVAGLLRAGEAAMKRMGSLDADTRKSTEKLMADGIAALATISDIIGRETSDADGASSDDVRDEYLGVLDAIDQILERAGSDDKGKKKREGEKVLSRAVRDCLTIPLRSRSARARRRPGWYPRPSRPG